MRQRGSTVEQLICNQWVAGSIPVAGSINMMRRPASKAGRLSSAGNYSRHFPSSLPLVPIPLDFEDIPKVFLEHLRRVYFRNMLYAIDGFDEMIPR